MPIAMIKEIQLFSVELESYFRIKKVMLCHLEINIRVMVPVALQFMRSIILCHGLCVFVNKVRDGNKNLYFYYFFNRCRCRDR